MSDKTKQIVLIAGFAASVLIIGGLLYFVFFRQVLGPEPGVLPVPGEELPPGVLPTPGEDIARPQPTPAEPPVSLADIVAQGRETQIQNLTLTRISHAAVSGNQINYYDPNDGRFYAMDQDGNAISLSDRQFPQAQKVSWNKQSDKAVIEFPDGSNVVYDFQTQNQVTLPKHWEDFAFTPGTDQIIAKNMAVDPNNRWLVVSNADGSNVKAVQALGQNAGKVMVNPAPGGQVIAFANTAEPLSGGLDRKMILPIGQNNENYKGLIVEGLGFLPNWSPDGRRLLYSASGAYSGEKPLLWIVDASPAAMGENRKSLGLNTWADKCVFTSASEAYCAVPQNLPENAGFQRALFRDYPDHLYKIDLDTGRTSLVAVPEKNVSMENLSVSQDRGVLYFTETDTNRLSSLRLK